MTSLKLAVVLAFVAQGASCDSLFGKSYETAFLEACDEVMKERLRSPSTYTRIGAFGYEQRSATLDDNRGWTNPIKRAEDQKMIDSDSQVRDLYEQEREVFDLAGGQTLTRALVKYDADNAYGVPVRGAYECTHVSFDDEEFDPGPTGVMVDGYTSLDWSLREMRSLRENLD